MAGPRPPRTPPSEPDGDGVRVVRKPRTARRVRAVWGLAALAAVALVAWWVLAGSRGGDSTSSGAASMPVDDAAPTPGEGLPAIARPQRPTSVVQEPEPMPRSDPEDLAAYFEPGDPEPSGAEVIKALQDAGVRTGLGAFNPPGTSPPLEGLAVPADFKLPDGYVRHHQVTDQGVPIEPILMFAPNFTLFDPRGRPIAMPADRVVPPELAPPGLPLRRVRIPKP